MDNGVGYKFLVNPSGDLKCLKCGQVAVEPWQHGKCGRLFCKHCLVKHGKGKPCPECKSFEPMPRYFEDNRSKKNIDALHVKCTNGACSWIGRFCGLQEHFALCTYIGVPCPRGCRDDKNAVRCFSKSSLTDHVTSECPNRDHVCKYCQEKDTYVFITEIHDRVCRKKLVPCPNSECGSIVQRKGVKRHLETSCAYESVPCKYAKLGCGETMKRCAITEHESDNQLHVQMAIDTVYMLKQRSSLVLKNGESMTFKMTKYQQRRGASEAFNAPQFSTTGGHCMNIQVYANGHGSSTGQYLSVITQVGTDRDHSDDDPFNGNITIYLLNQLADDNHHSKIGRNIPKFIALNKLDWNCTRKTQYLNDDTLFFKVTVDIPYPKPWLECTAS